MEASDKPNTLERLLIISWTFVGAAAICSLLLVVVPEIGFYVIGVFAVSVAGANLVISNFFKEELHRLHFRRRVVTLNLIILIVVAGLSAGGCLYAYATARKPPRSEQIVGVNLWPRFGLDNLQFTVNHVDRYIAEAYGNFFPCRPAAPDGKQLCAVALLAGDVVNDSSSSITAISFILTIDSKDFPAAFKWSGHCNSDAFTLSPGEKKFVVLAVPMLPLNSYKESSLRELPPLLSMTDSVNRRWNIVYREDNSDETNSLHSKEWLSIAMDCRENQ